MNARANQHPLKLRTTLHKLLILQLIAEAHHALHARAVVPAAIEKYHLAGGWKMRNIALKVPLRLLALSRRSKRNHAADTGIERLGDTLDSPALTRRIAPFK